MQRHMGLARLRKKASAPLALLVVVAMLALASGCSVEEPSSTAVQATPDNAVPDEELFTPIVGSVLDAPRIVRGTDDRDHVAYELFLTNTIGQAVTVDALSVRGDGEEIMRLSGEDLLPWMRAMGAPAPGYELASGQSATVILDVILPVGGTAPQMLSHLIEFSPETAMPPMITEQMKQTIVDAPVSPATPLVIGSPVSGDGWLDGNGCCGVSAHRSAINPINSALYAPERFAIDFVQLDEQSRIFDGPIDDLASYAYYGAEILAVGDGPIVSMKWDLPEEAPGLHPVGLELNEYGGNHIVQDLGDGHYAFYAHLQGENPEGLAVGQKMSRGDVLGYLGNSGNTDMPHLHFHVMDSPLPLGSNGLPFVFESFTLTGTVNDAELAECMSRSQSCGITASDKTAMTKVMPLQQDVISIAD